MSCPRPDKRCLCHQIPKAKLISCVAYKVETMQSLVILVQHLVEVKVDTTQVIYDEGSSQVGAHHWVVSDHLI